jgi:hypothetical protein
LRKLLASKPRNFRTREERPKLSSTEDHKESEKEIKRLREPGIKLSDVFLRFTVRVSPSKIKQIWLRSSSPNLDSLHDSHIRIIYNKVNNLTGCPADKRVRGRLQGHLQERNSSPSPYPPSPEGMVSMSKQPRWIDGTTVCGCSAGAFGESVQPKLTDTRNRKIEIQARRRTQDRGWSIPASRQAVPDLNENIKFFWASFTEDRSWRFAGTSQQAEERPFPACSAWGFDLGEQSPPPQLDTREMAGLSGPPSCKDLGQRKHWLRLRNDDFQCSPYHLPAPGIGPLLIQWPCSPSWCCV